MNLHHLQTYAGNVTRSIDRQLNILLHESGATDEEIETFLGLVEAHTQKLRAMLDDGTMESKRKPTRQGSGKP